LSKNGLEIGVTNLYSDSSMIKQENSPLFSVPNSDKSLITFDQIIS